MFFDRSKDPVSKHKLRLQVRCGLQRGGDLFGKVPGQDNVRVGRLNRGRLRKLTETCQRVIDRLGDRQFV